MDPYKAWEQICNEQGWNDESQIAHLEGFIRNRQLFPDFVAYARTAADEENRDAGLLDT